MSIGSSEESSISLPPTVHLTHSMFKCIIKLHIYTYSNIQKYK